MPNFDAQNTDRENSKPAPKSVSRDNDLKVSQRGSTQEVAREDNRDTQGRSDVGWNPREGGKNPGATIK
jgi:hypothetical protein